MSNRLSKTECKNLWDKAMQDEPAPEKEITSAEINNQSRERMNSRFSG